MNEQAVGSQEHPVFFGLAQQDISGEGKGGVGEINPFPAQVYRAGSLIATERLHTAHKELIAADMYVARQTDAVGVTDDVSLVIALRGAVRFQQTAVVDTGGKAVVGT